MKNQILFAGLALMGTVVVTSCSNEQSVNQPEVIPSNEIRLHVGNVNTRSESDDQAGTTLKVSNEVGVYAQADQSIAVTNGINNKYTVGEAGALTTETPMTTTASSVEVYAYAPYQSSWNDETENTFKVSTSQNNSLVSSDLVWATETATPGTDVALDFSHKLSQLKVKLVNNNDETLTVSNVYITNTITSTDIDLLTGSLSEDASATAENISILNSTSGKAIQSNESLMVYGIVVPQEITIGTQLVQIVTSDGTNYTAKVGQEVEFESGKAYTLTVNIGEPEEEIEIKFGNSSLNQWEDGNGDIDTDTEEQEDIFSLESSLSSVTSRNSYEWTSLSDGKYEYKATATSNNLATLYTFTEATTKYNTLYFTLSDMSLNSGTDGFRIGYGSSFTLFYGLENMNQDGTYVVKLDDLSLENSTAIQFGARNAGTATSTSPRTVKLSNVYLSSKTVEQSGKVEQ